MAEKLTAPIFDASGKAKGDVTLADSIFGIEPNVPVMHQVVTAQLAAARAGTHNTKTRAEVRGGGRKPWRQKGLGRARHGSIRSPIWSGGGVAHGPKPRDYSQRTPKKMKRLALRSALSTRAAEGQVRVVEEFDWSEPKTKQAVGLLEAIDAGPKVLLVLGSADQSALRSFRNIASVVVNDSGQVNTHDVVWADSVVFTSEALGRLTGEGDYSVGDEDFVKDEAPSPEFRVPSDVDDEGPEAEQDTEDTASEPEARSPQPAADEGAEGAEASEETS